MPITGGMNWPPNDDADSMAAAVAGGNEQAARPLEDVAEPLAGEADRRRVDQRLDFIDIVADDAEE
jgi:hypothetical protein